MRYATQEVAKAERAREKAAQQRESARIKADKASERQARADVKTADREYLAACSEEAASLTREVEERVRGAETLLERALSRSPRLDLLADLKTFSPTAFDNSPWKSTPPDLAAFTPKPLSFVERFLPGSAIRHERKVVEGRQQYDKAVETHRAMLSNRETAFLTSSKSEQARKNEIELHNSGVYERNRKLKSGDYEEVVHYYQAVLAASLQDDCDADSAEVGYSVESHHLVVDLELPSLEAIPEEVGFKYVKAADKIERITRPAAKRRLLYASLVSQASLKCVDTVFRAGLSSVVYNLTLNGMLETIDPATGQQIRVCLVSVSVSEDAFRQLNLRQVQADQCLRSLKASVSRSPAELLPVKPLVELDMVDPRFVDTVDVMSGLESRPNLMDLTPNEFEGLITNLFASMGLDTRQTRASRDGGVDCVAFDTRPVFGGKVVIQAKRYKNTVGVSAVRDLFGTVQNEGASKGILVTTSGYGKAAFDFAKGKPLELLDGGNLLHLLGEHAGIDARIVMPEGWVDQPIHGE